MDQLLVLDISGTEQERSCFEFFRLWTAPQLSGFDTSLWHQFILQASHHEPAIRHAAIALGSLHQKFAFNESSVLRSNNPPHPDAFALQQYVKAIGLLVQPISKRGKQAADVALIACVLFVCFEVSIAKRIRAFNKNRLTRWQDTPRTSWVSSVPYREWREDRGRAVGRKRGLADFS